MSADPHPPLINAGDARRAEMFPKISGPQLARLRRVGQVRPMRNGEAIWQEGQSNVSFFVVLEGALEIRFLSADGTQIVAVHEPGEFIGDPDLVAGRPAGGAGHARSDGSLLEIPHLAFQALLQTDAEIGELVLRAFLLRRASLLTHAQGDVVLVGSSHSAQTLVLQEFLTRNGRPHFTLDVERDPKAQDLLNDWHIGDEETPVVIIRGKSVLRRPSVEHLAECLGLRADLRGEAVRDLTIIGAGPAGLAAAVYGASEGLDVLVLESHAPGGQAGASSRIENYLGFPNGISGQELAGRAFAQAEKFGADIGIARSAAKLWCDRPPYEVELSDGAHVRTRTVIIATGARYRKPEIADLARFEGIGVYYGATHVEARLCVGDEVIVVGGGNSAGQAAVFLAGRARKVHVLVRGPSLAESMSRYLTRRIEETPNIELRTRTELTVLEGAEHLERVSWRGPDGALSSHPVRHVFLMTGAQPNTEWLKDCVAMDGDGFILTGGDLTPETLSAGGSPPTRAPYLLESSLPGVFAVGDVRASSVKRIASAVGEGSICVQFVHMVLAS